MKFLNAKRIQQMKRKFWMIFVEGRTQPTHKHFFLEAAHAEARRLAEKTGCATYVLASVHGYETVPIPQPKYELLGFEMFTEDQSQIF